jgi:hypothetical protein
VSSGGRQYEGKSLSQENGKYKDPVAQEFRNLMEVMPEDEAGRKVPGVSHGEPSRAKKKRLGFGCSEQWETNKRD